MSITPILTMLDTLGNTMFTLPGSFNGHSYYLVLKHRNSIETWSANPIGFNGNLNYDFTSSYDKALGNNLSDMGNGIFAIYSGDINQDGSIDFSDYPDLDIANNSGVLGYNVNDLNGDASVDFNDYPILDINSNNGIIVMRP